MRAFVSLLVLLACVVATPKIRAEEAHDAESLPVILLTGFEPFGAERPPNPSWEGVQRLDGKRWRGYRLVAKQLPVVWGAPQEHLARWMDEYKPVAVFSFGQGGGYALETQASNRRGHGGDNAGQRPQQAEIVAGGPASFAATINAEALAALLAKKGHRVAVSRDAGQYLCEECLYSLEYLKAKREFAGTVLFCHVPPLSEDYRPEHVEQFISDMLECWHDLGNDAQAVRPLERLRVSEDGQHFVTADSGQRFVVWGVNYDHDDAGRLLEDYWDTEWATVEEDFREIKALGANVVRIHLQLSQFMEARDQPNEANLARLAKLVKLAEQTRLYLDVTGLGCYHKQDVPAWYDELEEAARWQVQARFWEAVATVCRDSPAIFCYDLMNEPVLAGGKSEHDWLAGALGDKHFVQRITLDLAGRTREEVAKAWVKQLTNAIRQVDDQHMITVGVIPWAHVFKGAKPLFYAPDVGGPLDFVSVHFYPKQGEVAAALKALKVYEIGKPLVVEEFFPLKCSLEEADAFIEGSRAHADGWISFYWGKTIEQNEKQADLKGALLAGWLRYFRDHAPHLEKHTENDP